MTIIEELKVDLNTLKTERENIQELVTEDNHLEIVVQLLTHTIDRFKCAIDYMEHKKHPEGERTMPRYIVVTDEGNDWADVEACDPVEAIKKANIGVDGPFHVFGVVNYNKYEFQPRKLVRIDD